MALDFVEKSEVKYAIRMQIKSGNSAQERTLELSEGQLFVLGRETETTDTGGASRKHCALTVEDGELLIIDTGSRNGTFINDLEITRNHVKQNDLIRIGPHEIFIKNLAVTETPGLRPKAKQTPPPVGTPPPMSLKEEKPALPHTGEYYFQRKIEEQEQGQLGPNWYDKLPTELRAFLDKGDFPIRLLPDQFRLAVTSPIMFFEGTGFEGSPISSAVVILFSGFLLGLFSIKYGLLMPVLVPVMALSVLAVASAVLHWCRSWLGITAGFNEFLRFGAYINLFSLLAAIPGLIVAPLGALLNLLFFIWAAYGFYRAFKPKLIPTLIFGAFCTFVFGTAWVAMIWQALSVGKQNMLQALTSKGQPAIEVSNAIPTPEQLRARDHVPGQAQKDQKTKSFIGDFKTGEKYQYWVQLTGAKFKREGEFTITVKSVSDVAAVLAVEGHIEKEKKNFEVKVSWEMDLTALEKEFKDAGVDHIVNLLLSYRNKLQLLNGSPEKELPLSLQNSVAMAVAGIRGDYYRNWGPSRQIAKASGPLDIAVSPAHSLPIFVLGKNGDTKEAIYVRLKTYAPAKGNGI